MGFPNQEGVKNHWIVFLAFFLCLRPGVLCPVLLTPPAWLAVPVKPGGKWRYTDKRELLLAQRLWYGQHLLPFKVSSCAVVSEGLQHRLAQVQILRVSGSCPPTLTRRRLKI